MGTSQEGSEPELCTIAIKKSAADPTDQRRHCFVLFSDLIKSASTSGARATAIADRRSAHCDQCRRQKDRRRADATPRCANRHTANGSVASQGNRTGRAVWLNFNRLGASQRNRALKVIDLHCAIGAREHAVPSEKAVAILKGIRDITPDDQDRSRGA